MFFEEKVMSVAGISSSNLFDFITRASRTESSNSSRSSSNSARTCNPEICPRRKPISHSNSPGRRSVRLRRISNPIAQDFKQLSQDIQSGDISSRPAGLREDPAGLPESAHWQSKLTIIIKVVAVVEPAISQLMQELGQDLQTGSLSAAQQAYSSLQQDFQQFAQSSGLFQSGLQPIQTPSR